jgi:hypothetical protein
MITSFLQQVQVELESFSIYLLFVRFNPQAFRSQLCRNDCFSFECQSVRGLFCRSSPCSSIGPKDFLEVVRPVTFPVTQLLFQNFENVLVGGFHLPIRLRMSGRGEVILNMKFGTPFSEWFAVKLFPIVSDKRLWHTVAADDILPL